MTCMGVLNQLRAYAHDGRTLSFNHCVWISPVVFMAHALEDAPDLAQWMRTIPLFEPVSRGQVIAALIFLIGLCLVSTYLADRSPRWGIYTFVWVQCFLFLHGIAHLIPSLWLLAYTPGLVTGILLIPFSWYVFRRIRKQRRISRKMLTAVFAIAVVSYNPVLRIAFKLGGLFSKPPTVEPVPLPRDDRVVVQVRNTFPGAASPDAESCPTIR